MWNVELKAMDYFRHVFPHDLEYLGPVSPNLPGAQYQCTVMECIYGKNYEEQLFWEHF